MKKKILLPLGLLFSMIMIFFLTGCGSDIAGDKISFDDGISSNARLSNLTLSSGELNYAFNPYDWVYESSVSFEVTSIKITPVVEHSHATVTIGGVPVTSGSASDSIPLNVGENVINILVTAWDGTENIYTVTVVRMVSDNADLSSLAIADNKSTVADESDDTVLPLKEAFSANTLEYSAVVAQDVTYIKMAFTAEEGTVDVQKAGSGIGNLNNIELSLGLNRFLITVTAPDNTTRKYYTLSVTRLIGTPDNGKVTGFVIQSVNLDPAYDYEDIVDWGSGITFETDSEIAIGKMEGDTPSAKLVINTESAAALVTITMNGESTEIDGTATAGSLEYELRAKPALGSAYTGGDFEGFEVDTSCEMIVTITSGNGTTHVSTFTVNIEVTSGSSNADLAGLALYWGSYNSQRVIYPGTFIHDATYHNPQVYVTGDLSPIQTEYVALVYGTETAKIVARPAEANVTYVRFNGADGTLIDGSYVYSAVLSKGLVTTVTIEVMPESGKTSQIKTYTLSIKLLNAYEYYWGIYGPMNNKCFTRWEALFGSQGVKTVNIPGVITGNLVWAVTLSGVQPRNTMTWTQYMDGNRNSAGYSLQVDYNDNHPTDNALHGFMMNGSVSGLLDGITSKNGIITGGFNLYSPWGDLIGRVNANYVVEGGTKMEDANSYADFEYMGETIRMMYRDDDDGNSQMSPYPFTDTYDWSQSWNPGSY